MLGISLLNSLRDSLLIEWLCFAGRKENNFLGNVNLREISLEERSVELLIVECGNCQEIRLKLCIHSSKLNFTVAKPVHRCLVYR